MSNRERDEIEITIRMPLKSTRKHFKNILIYNRTELLPHIVIFLLTRGILNI